MNGGPQSLTDWIRYLHNAAQEPKDSPYYAESRVEMAKALRHINALQVAANQAEAQGAEYGSAVSTPAALGVGALHGLSFGAGEPISGIASALTGGSFGEGAQKYRSGLENVEVQHPVPTVGAEITSPFLLPGTAIGREVASGVQAGVPMTVAGGLGLLAKGAAAGAVPGAIAGFSAGGEDPGDLAARAEAAKNSAILGGILGATLTGIAARATRGHVERAANITQKGNQRALTASRLAESQARLARMKPPTLPPGVTAEEAAVAKTLGLPVEQVQGRVGIRPAAPPSPVPDPLDVATYLRRGTGRGLSTQVGGQGGNLTAPVSPLTQTESEAAATTASKALKALQRLAARKAFNAAIAAGQTHEEASIAARWAATHVRAP